MVHSYVIWRQFCWIDSNVSIYMPRWKRWTRCEDHRFWKSRLGYTKHMFQHLSRQMRKQQNCQDSRPSSRHWSRVPIQKYLYTGLLVMQSYGWETSRHWSRVPIQEYLYTGLLVMQSYGWETSRHWSRVPVQEYLYTGLLVMQSYGWETKSKVTALN
jgi:hypothetical protein